VVPLDASIETLANMQLEGKIRLIGLSNVTQEHIERARKIVPIVSVQNRYMPIANGTTSRIIANATRWRSSRGFRLGVAAKVLDRIAKARQAKSIQVALAWLLRRSPVMLPIPGTSSIAHLDENVEAAALELSDAEYLELTGVAQLAF